MSSYSLYALPLLFLAACNAEPVPSLPPVIIEPTVADHWTPVTPDDLGEVSVDPAVETDGKIARRLSVDQLRKSIPALFDGITWTVRIQNQTVNGFDALARTLGEPDYIQSTQENLEASPLFAKFMDDMAGDVCRKAVEHDKTAGNSKVLVLDADDVAGTIRSLRLKLHAIHLAPGSSEGIEDYVAMHGALLASDGADMAWAGVCVAMLTAPELMLY